MYKYFVPDEPPADSDGGRIRLVSDSKVPSAPHSRDTGDIASGKNDHAM